MRELIANIWDVATITDAIVITTNGFVKRNGEAVMGRGIAREAAIRHPWMPGALAHIIQTSGNHVGLLAKANIATGPAIYSMPVKHNWWEEADPYLILRSIHELVAIEQTIGYLQIYMPRPGCGNGRLSWTDIRPMIEPHLDDHFVVCHR